MSEIFLKAKNIVKSFSGMTALNQVNIEIRKGEIHSLAGENGCGKSTLIKIISGAYSMDSGEIEINGKPYTKITPLQAIQEGIQVIYQDFAVFPNLTVKENIAMNSEMSSNKRLVNWRHIEKVAREAVALIDVDLDLDKNVSDIPVADKQLVAICRALINDAKLLIMDEPTTALTKKEVRSLFKIVSQLREKGISILFVSHKLDEVCEICDRYTIFRNGENVITNSKEKLDDKKFAYYMTGREFENSGFQPVRACTTPLLEAKNLSLDNGFSDISFALYPGEILGVTGLLGSGRTELALSLFGVYPATSGELFINGKPVVIDSIKAAISNGIGYVPEDRLTEGLFMSQSIAKNLMISKLRRMADKGVLNKYKVRQEADELAKQMKIKTTDTDNPVQTLSGGNQQRVVLGKWIAMDSSILILNGPTVGVDIGSKYDIHIMLKDLAGKGVGVIVISDDLPELMATTNRILIMKHGTIVSDFSTSEIQEANLIAHIGG